MNQNIITYLNENKEQYSKEALVDELEKSGYEKGEIAEGVAQVFSLSTPAKTSFWNFKDKKVYTKASEKWADFLFGVFAPILIGFVLSSLSFFLIRFPFDKLIVVLWVIASVYLFKRRRMMFYGLLASLILLPTVLLFFTFLVLARF